MARTEASPANARVVREHNLALALAVIARSDAPLSRADISATTGMTRATASSLVETLIEARLVEEVAPTRLGAGRPAAGLVLRRDAAAGIGLEINVDYVAACVLDLTGEVRHREVRVGDQRAVAPQTSLALAGRLAGRARDMARDAGLVPAGVALAVPGIVHAPHGPVHLAPNLGWRDVDVLALAARQPGLSGIPVYVGNEANYAALAELMAGQHGRSFLHVSGEVGIGASIVLDGELFAGRHGWSGEIGHVTVDPRGPLCACGSRGCLEQYAGQEAILRNARLPAAVGTTLGIEPTLALLLDEARRGNRRLLTALRRAGTSLGVAVSGALNLLDLDTVVLGGIYGPLSPWIAPAVETELAARVLAAPWAELDVRASSLGGHDAVVGAAAFVTRSVIDDPAAWIERCTSEDVQRSIGG